MMRREFVDRDLRSAGWVALQEKEIIDITECQRVSYNIAFI